MEKSNELRKVLNFYVLSNELKNEIIDEQNSYSVADHLFGSITLATAIDSEFKETDNLPKIYRMLLLTEFSDLYPNYDFENLNLWNQYTCEILEARNMSIESGKLVFKYKMLDYILTKLIKENEDAFTPSQLIIEGSKIIALLCDRQPSECEEIFKFYYLNFRLKNKVRTGWDSNHWNIKADRIETVSEHVIGSLYMAIILNSEFKYEFKDDLDINKVLKMLTIHEVGETLIGDITPFDGITPEKKKEIEHQAMEEALGNLKEKEKLLSLLFEFDEHMTLEAKYSYYCDKIEADLQAKIYQDKGMQHSLDNQKNNVTFNSLKAKKMLENGTKDAFDIWYEWDKAIYMGDSQFPEFFNMLKTARVNNLLHLGRVVKERVNLTDEEHCFLSQELTNTITELCKDDNITSVYITNYQDSDNIKGSLEVMILLNSGADYYHYEYLMDKLNSKIALDNKTGVNISFECGYESVYSTTATNPRLVCRAEQLAESTILFDKTGELRVIQEEMKKRTHLFDFCLVDYIPPVDQTILHRLTKVK